MSSSRMISRKKTTVIMTHICSYCNNPVLIPVNIITEGEKTYTFSQDRALEIAEETAIAAVDEEIARIESCRNNGKVLTEKSGRAESICVTPGLFCRASIYRFEHPCPNCHNVEPWQSKENSTKPMGVLTQDNFPVVYKDKNEAVSWAQKYIKNILAPKIATERADYAKRSEAAMIASYAEKEIATFEDLLRNIPEEQEKERILVDVRRLNGHKQELGIFDAAEKKRINREVRPLLDRVSFLEPLIKAQQEELDKKITSSRLKMQRCRAIAYGVLGIGIIEQHGDVAFFVEPSEDEMNGGNISEPIVHNVQSITSDSGSDMEFEEAFGTLDMPHIGQYFHLPIKADAQYVVAELKRIIEKPIATKAVFDLYLTICFQRVASQIDSELVVQSLQRQFKYGIKNETFYQAIFFVEEHLTENVSAQEIAHTPLAESQDIGPLFCRKCGNKLLPESSFCSKCGSKIDCEE